MCVMFLGTFEMNLSEKRLNRYNFFSDIKQSLFRMSITAIRPSFPGK